MMAAVGTGKPGGSLAEIQPCGFMVVLDPDWRVAHVSANISDHFADCGRVMAGQPLAEFFGESAVHALRNQLALIRDPAATAQLFSLFFASVPKPFDVAMHLAAGKIILEVLPAAHIQAGDPAGTVRQLAAQLDDCIAPDDLFGRGAQLLRALVGFDSVTLFRGAERVGHNARGSFGPAERCPPLGLRMIADAGRPASPLDPDCDPALLDRALLRCPSGAERDASRAEGAAAVLVVPLRSAGRDFGVAICRNRGPRQPALDRIAAAELFGEMLAMRAELAELRAGTSA